VADPSTSARTEEVGSLREPGEKLYDPEPHRERMRGALAIGLVAMLGGTILLGYIALWWDWASASEVKDFLSVVMSPLVALAGSAVGFYFGGRSRP
jgi:hypothetical protein